MKIAIYTASILEEKMAGPAIRALELAKVLSNEFQVYIISGNHNENEIDKIKIFSNKKDSWKMLIQDVDLIITQIISFELVLLAKNFGAKIIYDIYASMPLECLEITKFLPREEQRKAYGQSLQDLKFIFKWADGFICANEKQKDLWTGYLMATGSITLDRYKEDPLLENLIAVVPFGLSKVQPNSDNLLLRRKYGLKDKDKILVWGGGIWNWFDPLTLIKAINIIKNLRDDVKLVFLGVKSPDNAMLPDTKMCFEAIKLSKELELFDKFVFFNFDWISYKDRHCYLLDADIGVSCHFNHLETRFSFRTRILDYLWAELPIIATEGDYFASLIDKKLGLVVPYEDEKALSEAILTMSDSSEEYKKMKSNIRIAKQDFYWENVSKPLIKMIYKLKDNEKKRISPTLFKLKYRCLKVKDKCEKLLQKK